MIYLVGLGNPGAKYVGTRHNAGEAMLATFIASQNFPAPTVEKKIQASVARGTVGTQPVCAVFPLTYMNQSGVAVAAAQRYYGPGSVVALYDDVDLPVGTMKLSAQGGAGGHNGVKSLISALGNEFVRVRIGIAPVSFWTGKATRPRGDHLPDFVLQSFTARERSALTVLQPKVSEALTCIVTEGVTAAMNRYN